MWVEGQGPLIVHRPCPRAQSSTPAIGSGTVPVRAISHRLSFMRADNLSSQQWGLKS